MDGNASIARSGGAPAAARPRSEALTIASAGLKS
jgi:hypothetical protein